MSVKLIKTILLVCLLVVFVTGCSSGYSSALNSTDNMEEDIGTFVVHDAHSLGSSEPIETVGAIESADHAKAAPESGDSRNIRKTKRRAYPGTNLLLPPAQP